MPAFRNFLVASSVVAAAWLPGCGGGGDDDGVAPVTVTNVGANAVSSWNEVAAATITAPASATGTPEEQRPSYSVDLATVHVAIYDTMMAIVGTHKPFAVTPATSGAGASQDAAIASAAYRVLLGLYPSRTALYQAAYDSALAAIADSAAKTQGIALGADVAAKVLALRANDGRAVVLAPYVPGSAPGQFRGVNPVNRNGAYIKPFALISTAQFRAPAPPALTSAAYAADVNETKALGAATSTTRTAEQTELARFHTEAPPLFWTRNMRSFAMTDRSLAEQARLMAIVWVVQADAGDACFESKYFHNAWRPTSAITLADTDGNDATAVDAAWTPVVPTPNHPEYPAAHGCIAGSMARALELYYRTASVTFDLTSTVTSSTHHFTTLQGMADEVVVARVAGGMHFRHSVVAGETLGRSVADFVMANNFQPR